MKKRELILKLINDYETNLNIIKKKRMNFSRTLKFLEKNKMGWGICSYVSRSINTKIGIWINKYTVCNEKGETGNSFWTIVPSECINREEIITSMNKRIEILKTELKLTRK